MILGLKELHDDFYKFTLLVTMVSNPIPETNLLNPLRRVFYCLSQSIYQGDGFLRYNPLHHIERIVWIPTLSL